MAIAGTEELLVKTVSGTIVKTNTINDVRAYIGPGLPSSPIANAIPYANSTPNAFINSSNFTYNGSTLTVTASSSSALPLVVKAAASHTANLVEIQDSSGTVLTSIKSTGTCYFGNGCCVGGAYRMAGQRLVVNQTDGTNGSAVIEFYNGSGYMFWFLDQVSNGNDGQIRTDSSQSIILQSNETSSGGVGCGKRYPLAKFHSQSYSTSQVTEITQAASSQTADLKQFQNSSTAVLSRVNKAGHFISAQTTAPADGDLNNGEVCVYWDGSDLKIKAKTSGGTIKTGTVTLT